MKETLPYARMKLDSLGCLLGAAEAILWNGEPLKLEISTNNLKLHDGT